MYINVNIGNLLCALYLCYCNIHTAFNEYFCIKLFEKGCFYIFSIQEAGVTFPCFVFLSLES